MPLILFPNSALSVWKETALLFNLTWVYNDLGGGDDNRLVRNIIIAFAFFFYNLGSLKVATGASGQVEHVLSSAAFACTAVVSAVILTTMHVQDLKDQEGDRSHNRQTAPLVLGDSLARWMISVPVLFWSFVCAQFWRFWTLPSCLSSSMEAGKRGGPTIVEAMVSMDCRALPASPSVQSLYISLFIILVYILRYACRRTRDACSS